MPLKIIQTESKVLAMRVKQLCKEYGLILFVLFLLLMERLIALRFLGVAYNLKSDDLSYINAGIVFFDTHQITMHNVLSAQIMPGMPVLIALFVLVFGKGYMLWLSLKITWIIMGILSGLFIYKSIRIFAPKWAATLPVLFLLLPDFVWQDSLILTETPFMLALTIMMYATFRLAETRRFKYFIVCLLSYLFALMLKVNIGVFPVFAGLYLVIKKYDIKLLLKQGFIAFCALMIFVVPWTIRNYALYDAFIPLTYGVGNPMLRGTYQGANHPLDEELDYVTNVDHVMDKLYEKYIPKGYNYQAVLDGDVYVESYIRKYLRLEYDKVKAEYRKEEWKAKDSSDMLYSYLVHKPMSMIYGEQSSFYWKELINGTKSICIISRKIDLVLILLGTIASFIIKKYRAELAFLFAFYLSNIYIYSMTFAFDRYAQPLLVMRYVACGLSLYCLYLLVSKRFRKRTVDALEG